MGKTNEKRCPPSLIIFSSAFIWAGAVAFSATSPLLGLLCFAGVAIGIGELAHMITASKIERFCKQVNLQVNEEFPRVLDTNDYDGGVKYTVSLPCGMSIKSFEKHLPELEAYLEGSVSLSSDKNKLFVDVCHTKLKEFYEYESKPCDNPLEVCIGYSHKGQYNINIEDAPHILIAGATGAGKSVLLRSIITSLVTQKRDIELNLTDFQRVELNLFSKCSCVNDFCTTPESFSTLLLRMKVESESRLKEFDKTDCINIKEYNKKRKNKYKYIINIVDEFAALSEPEYKGILQELKVRVAQDRKCGIHYIVCTQRPSVDIISGSIKANIPMRICLKTSSEIDSRVVLDSTGAELLRGKGHALVRTDGLDEIQTMYLSDTKAKTLCKPFMINKEEAQKKTRTGVVPSGNRTRQKNR